jgi:hypothetical protein
VGPESPSPKIPDISQVLELTEYRPRTKLDDSLRKIHTWLLADAANSFVTRWREPKGDGINGVNRM